jgi:hypothetical protein
MLNRGPSTPLRFAQDFGWRLGRRQNASSSARKPASPHIKLDSYKNLKGAVTDLS